MLQINQMSNIIVWLCPLNQAPRPIGFQRDFSKNAKEKFLLERSWEMFRKSHLKKTPAMGHLWIGSGQVGPSRIFLLIFIFFNTNSYSTKNKTYSDFLPLNPSPPHVLIGPDLKAQAGSKPMNTPPTCHIPKQAASQELLNVAQECRLFMPKPIASQNFSMWFWNLKSPKWFP